MKTKNILLVLLMMSYILIGYCGKKDKESEKSMEMIEREKFAHSICDKMISCMAESMKSQLDTIESQKNLLKEQCVKGMLKFTKEDTKNKQNQEAITISKEDLQQCLNALNNATCEQIIQNQIEACKKLSTK